MLSIIATRTADLVPFATCVIYLYSTEKGHIVAEHASGEHAEVFLGHGIGLGEKISGWVAARREALINADAALDLASIPGKLKAAPEFALMHPLVFEDRCIGIISLCASRKDRFKDDNLRILGSICQKAASAIQNAQKYGEAQEEASADPLTGLHEIRYLRQYLTQELAKPKRYGYSLSLLGMELDGFKAVNDEYFHQAGDRVLVEVARVLRKSLRESDLVARLGGDEFIAALLQTTHEDALRLANKIQRTIEDISLEVSPGQFARVGISIGCASYPEHGSTLEELLHAADSGMYSDKKSRTGLTVTALTG